VKQKNIPLSRVHLHPYGSFLMCYKKEKWQTAYDAIIKSSIALPKYCIQSDEWVQNSENFEVPDLPEYLTIGDRKIKISADSLTYNFDLDSEIECYLEFYFRCKEVVRTAGMGDTISGVGLIYH